ncbi:MAG: hypothetical protein KME43_04880 [Myxacorys chilensis ATA2-1-KO14]|nr:hypothetical protein [Myxacorys chilensis ATA2-1-KO14]
MSSSTSTSSDFISVLDQAALAFRSREVSRPAAEDVVNALLQTEKAAKQRPLDYSLMQLQGQWQLCFATGTRKIRQGGIRLKQGYYVPKIVSAHISFDTDESGAATIGNQAQLGFLQLNLSGPARYQRKKNLLMFEFTQLQLRLGRTSLYRGTIRGGDAKEKAFAQTSIAKLPFFAFFLITENFIAARGRGGGLALWVKS